jgi:hypothetical protein
MIKKDRKGHKSKIFREVKHGSNTGRTEGEDETKMHHKQQDEEGAEIETDNNAANNLLHLNKMADDESIMKEVTKNELIIVEEKQVRAKTEKRKGEKESHGHGDKKTRSKSFFCMRKKRQNYIKENERDSRGSASGSN